MAVTTQGATEMSDTNSADSRNAESSDTNEEPSGPTPKATPERRRFAVPREFTNYDRNALTWRTGTALEIFERSAKVRPEPEPD